MSDNEDVIWEQSRKESLIKLQQAERELKEVTHKRKEQKNIYEIAMKMVEQEKLTKEEAEENFGIKLTGLSPKHTGFYTKNKNGLAPDYYAWADHYILVRKFFTYEGGYYIYDDSKKHYRRITDNEIDYHLTVDTKRKVKPEHRNNFLRTLKASSYRPMEEMERTSEMLNLKNGVLNIRTKELTPHDGSLFFTYCLPHEYDDKADCPKWIKFLDDVFEGSEELKNVSAQVFGYIMLGGHPWLHKAFVLYGEGRNGKSTFLDILKLLIGRKNYTTVSLSNLDKAFSIVRLDSTLANIIEETPNDKINAEVFKTAIGGGDLIGAQKYQDEYTFQCSARFIFACNELPKFSESSVGLQERLYFMPFNTYFAKAKRNGNIIKELKAELPGILNWALNGLDILLDNAYIPDCEASNKVFEQYQNEADSVYSWANENIKFDDKMLFVKSKELYSKYRLDLVDTGRKPVSDIVFYRRFKKYVREKLPKAEETRDTTQEHRGYKHIYYRGVSIQFQTFRP